VNRFATDSSDDDDDDDHDVGYDDDDGDVSDDTTTRMSISARVKNVVCLRANYCIGCATTHTGSALKSRKMSLLIARGVRILAFYKEN